MSRNTKKRKSSLLKDWLPAIIIALLITIVFRAFFFQSFSIPTTSMLSTLQNGDVIIVNKMSYGIRTPISPFGVPFCRKRLPWGDGKSYIDKRLEYNRIGKFKRPERYDVIAFNYPLEEHLPIDRRTPFIKRVVGIPGDTISFLKGDIYLGKTKTEKIENTLFHYYIETSEEGLPEGFYERYNIREGGPLEDPFTFYFGLKENDATELKKNSNILRIEKMLLKSGEGDEFVFPGPEFPDWNQDNMGPIYVPAKGDTLFLSPENLTFFNRLISVYENNRLEIKNDGIYINGELQSYYVCKMDYFFVCGDNFCNSVDSRFWGYVPEDHIIGKASSILFSIDPLLSFPQNIHFDRFFKGIL